MVEGRIEVRTMLPLSLSFDHRVVDGAEAARFLNTVIDHLEDPDLILLEAWGFPPCLSSLHLLKLVL